jgi:hypothetical protein
MQNEGKKNKSKKCQNPSENRLPDWTDNVCLSDFSSEVKISTDKLFHLDFPNEEQLNLTFPSRGFG